jgi:hypothetical protein
MNRPATRDGPRTRPASPAVIDADLVRNAVELISGILPDPWRCEAIDPAPSRSGADAVIELSLDTQRVYLLVKAKSVVDRRDVPYLCEQLAQWSAAAQAYGEHRAPFVAARYLSRSVQDALTERGVSYADTTGNLCLRIERPWLFIRERGASRDPGRGRGRPLGTLAGLPAARVVRALADFAPPMTMRVLAERSAASIGATYRAVDLLEREALVERDAKGTLTSCDWPAMLRRWSDDYQFTSNPVSRYVAPRGIDTLVEVMKPRKTKYAVTGALAAAHLAPHAPVRLAMIYADDPAFLAQIWGLAEADAGANVLIARAPADLPWIRAKAIDRITYVAPSQAVVDLLHAPGRGPEEAEALMDWMGRNIDAWRR